ncbi:MAG: methyltransferase [Methanomicrobiales archaeon]|nr:methyltransferase [Methanomicrobiales archaeon]
MYPVREDTLLLLEAASEEIRPSDQVLEVGVGSGYIARRLQGNVAWIVTTDISPYAVLKVKEANVDVLRTDLLAGICGAFDLILFNPPYLPTQPDERIADWLEYALDGGPTGREVITRFAGQAGSVLKEQGRILLVISSLTGQKEVERLFEHRGFTGQIVKETEIEGEVLFVYRFRKISP